MHADISSIKNCLYCPQFKSTMCNYYYRNCLLCSERRNPERLLEFLSRSTYVVTNAVHRSMYLDNATTRHGYEYTNE